MLVSSTLYIHLIASGCHDNGYTSTLNYLQNEGLLDKITLLRGYEVLANELRSLNLPQLEIKGVFMAKKLQSKSGLKISLPSTVMQPLQPKDFEIFKTSLPSLSDMPNGTKKPLRHVTQVFISRFIICHSA